MVKRVRVPSPLLRSAPSPCIARHALLSSTPVVVRASSPLQQRKTRRDLVRALVFINNDDDKEEDITGDSDVWKALAMIGGR